AGLVEDADEQRPCVQVHAHVRCGRLIEESHGEDSGDQGNRNLQQYPSAAPDRGGITAFRDSTALRPPRQLSGVDYEAVASSVLVDPSWGLVLGRPESECVGRIRVPRDESRSGGQAPAARIPSEPGAACVTD